MPISASIGEKVLGFSMVKNTLLLSMPVSDSSQEVIQVPILAPIIMPTTWFSAIMPEFTKPTAITVTALEDWITAVTPAPSSTPLMRLLVIFSSTDSNLPPPIFSRPLPITFMPKRKSARPPIRLKKLKIVIGYTPLFSVLSCFLFCSHLAYRKSVKFEFGQC